MPTALRMVRSFPFWTVSVQILIARMRSSTRNTLCGSWRKYFQVTTQRWQFDIFAWHKFSTTASYQKRHENTLRNRARFGTKYRKPGAKKRKPTGCEEMAT